MADHLPRLLALAAADLDDRGNPNAGLLRQAARRIAEQDRRIASLEARLPASPLRCGWCGAPLARAATGRPRRWCSAACKRRAQRAGS